MNQKYFPVYLIGPTAVGKTKISLLISERLPVEIVSCDSMQIYRHMDIGTAKPSKEIQNNIPHHMIDIIEPSENYNVHKYAQHAKKQIQSILNKNKYPLVIAGTGLYFKALTDGLFEEAGRNHNIRKELHTKINKYGLQYLYKTLQEIDPIAAKTISVNDQKRIIRALEVYYLTGKPISSLKTQWNKKKSVCVIGLNRERKELYERINKRVDEMFKLGLLEEVKALIQRGIQPESTALQALGYKEIVEYLNGIVSLGQCKEKIKAGTRKFAKRQLTWFRKDDRVKWFSAAGTDMSELTTNIVNYIHNWKNERTRDFHNTRRD